ncbi:MAG: pyruvate kinase, partial [Microgenomates group bacterium]
VDVFRFNFKHNKTSWHSHMIEKVNNVANKLSKPIGTLIDLQGPEIRLFILKNLEQIELKKNQLLEIGVDIQFSHPQIKEILKNNQKILVDDGYFIFIVKKNNNKIYLQSQTQGLLKNRKTVNLPEVNLDFPSLVERDFEGLKLAAIKEIDYIALSFVRSDKDIIDLKNEMKKYNVKSKIIAKIETKKAIDNIDSIIKEVDGVMVARGDMAVEISWESVPYYQKMIIKKAREAGKFVITATQMLESMINNPLPTRAEVSDVANAFYDGTDAVMLSAESASGRYPIEAVLMMKKILEFNESRFSWQDNYGLLNLSNDETDLITRAAFEIYQKIKNQQRLAGFIVFTETGKTAITLSRFHPKIPIFAISPNKKIADFLNVYFGIYPVVYPLLRSGLVDINEINKVIKFLVSNFKTSKLKENQSFVVLHGDYWGKTGGTSTVRIVNI